mgnify:CR=1 FL=1
MAALLSACLLLSGTAFGQNHSQRTMPAIAAQYPPADQRAKKQVLYLPLSDGPHLRVLLATPPQPRGLIVTFPGGAGDIGVQRDGHIAHAENFVVRTRDLWNRHGYAVLIPDTPEGANLRGLRSSPFYAHLADSLIALAHQHTTGPVFLLGTSQGSIAAVNGATHLSPAALLALCSLNPFPSWEAVANRDDLYNVAPPYGSQSP